MAKKFYIETLGCNKNTVDSEIIVSLLLKKGFIHSKNPEEADYIIVNTCGFIDSVKEESIDTILEFAEIKKKVKEKRLIVTGCFSQLYHQILKKEIPEIDAVFGVGNLNSVVSVIENNSEGNKLVYNESFNIGSSYREYIPRDYISTKGFAYIKIAEGCNRKCTFCLIPKIKGKYRSRKPESIIDEIRHLEDKNIYEINLVSQDTLSYGNDIGIKDGLSKLIEGILENTKIKYVRLLYLRPSREVMNLLPIFNEKRVVPYFDIPIQHVSAKILKSMKREGSKEEYKELINNIREKVSNPVIRTSVIVGFPGEGEKEYNELVSFIKDIKFNHLGVFIFSPQKETEAYKLPGRVKKKIAEIREKELLEVQAGISESLLKKEVGKIYNVLIEEKVRGENIYFGRSYHFAPEVDGLFVVHSAKRLKVPALVRCRVTRAETYDLHGIPV